MLLWEQIAPSHVGKGGFAPIMRLTMAVSLTAGFLMFYQRSIRKQYFFRTLSSALLHWYFPYLNSSLISRCCVNRYTDRFYGFSENRREVDRDMREMVARVKQGEPLYGRSSMTDYMQGVASRNSRYSGVFLHVIPWFNFVNHKQV